jgi:adenosylcobinamide-GDP ribazoletransferase
MDDDAMFQVAVYMPIFPVIGALIGLLAGVFVWVIGLFLQTMIAGALGLGFILLLNGVQHFDGLLDFGDGLMCHGSRERKLRVMRDPRTGAGGLSLGLIVLLTTALSIAALGRSNIVQSLAVSEAAAKFSMVFEAWAGKSAQEGMGASFIKAMHGKHRNTRIAASFSILLVIAVLGLRTIGVFVVVAPILVSIVDVRISGKAFGGITGDIMGASNELTRLVSLLVIIGAMQWV